MNAIELIREDRDRLYVELCLLVDNFAKRHGINKVDVKIECRERCYGLKDTWHICSECKIDIGI